MLEQSIRKLNILQIANKPPYPSTDGGSIAMYVLAKGLYLQGANLTILSAYSHKHPIDSLEMEYFSGIDLVPVYVDLRLKVKDAFLNLFTKHSYLMYRFISKRFASELKRLLQTNTYDIIQIESIFMAVYIPIIRKYSSAKIYIRTHNVEHLIWERLALATKFGLKKLYYKLLAKRLKEEEVFWLKKADGILPITKKDEAFFKQMGIKTPSYYVPFGVLDAFLPDISIIEHPTLFFIGAMNWLPNVEGVKWFLDNVWDDLHKKYPDIKFYIAGRHMPDCLRNCTKDNVIVLGEVENAQIFMSTKSIMLVPLLSGSGVRVKIIEAMLLGKCIITTSIGAEGIDYVSGEEILIANDSAEFLREISKAVNDRELVVRVGEKARELVINKHNNNIISENLFNFYKGSVKK